MHATDGYSRRCYFLLLISLTLLVASDLLLLSLSRSQLLSAVSAVVSSVLLMSSEAAPMMPGGKSAPRAVSPETLQLVQSHRAAIEKAAGVDHYDRFEPVSERSQVVSRTGTGEQLELQPSTRRLPQRADRVLLRSSPLLLHPLPRLRCGVFRWLV